MNYPIVFILALFSITTVLADDAAKPIGGMTLSENSDEKKAYNEKKQQAKDSANTTNKRRDKDVIFKPSEQISEDLSVPFPTDI